MTTAIETTATETTTAAETPKIAIETPTTAPIEPTDEALIATAKRFNKSMERHLRSGIEAFWKLGETLAALYKRRHLHADGRWATLLKQVGISTTTDNHARRFYAACEFADLGLYKNKTEALRTLGIMASHDGARKESADKATKPTSPPATNEPNENAEDVGIGRKDVAPIEVDNDTTQQRRPEANDVEHGVKDQNRQVPKPGDERDLLTLSRIAALLEELANEGLAPTADDLAHLDRIAEVVTRLKEVALVAAA